MKRCSTCNRTYTDPNLSFCIDDGTPLTTVAADDESTVVSPRATETGSDTQWEAAPYRPPSSYVPPGAGPKQRRVWPWVVGIGGAFILGIVVISVAAFILVPRALRRSQSEPPRVVVETPNNNRSENSNTNESANTNSDANVNANVDAPPPTDRDQVLAQLRDLENDWTVANLNADKKLLNRILADDYVGSGRDGNPQSKAEYIRTVERDGRVEKWEFKDLSVLLAGDRATLSGRVLFVTPDGEVEFDFKDKFVWRDGRWQATGSEVTQRQD
jgi:Domain of unknown function (DUF4440)